MGIYDRDYIQRDPPGFQLGGSQMTMTTKIIIATAAVYLVQMVTRQPSRQHPPTWFNDFFALHADWVKRPWMFFELLSYGFMHSVWDLKHILFNMLIVWFLARDIEYRYGRGEFLAFYLTSIVIAGLVWSGVHLMRGHAETYTAIGASGGCAAVLVLFAFNWPRRQVLLFFVIPLPVWVVALFAVGNDIFGAVRQSGNIGYEAHLGGAAFALLYYRFGWQLSRFLPARIALPKVGRRPKLRVHDPQPDDDSGIDAEVDEILRKIQREGQDSLTPKERKTLEDASREYQKKKK